MQELLKKAEKIKLLVCDLDGVLTSGLFYYTDNGVEHLTFHVRDGFGLKLLQRINVHVALITTSTSPIIDKRMKDLGIEFVYKGHHKKVQAYEELLANLSLQDHQVAYIGDDLPDLPLIKRSGLGVAVGNANEVVRETADWVTEHFGGHGAVREVCDVILKAKNEHGKIVEEYLE